MKTTQLTLSDPALVAEFVRQEEFKGFFEKRLEVPPDHMGLLMRNGQFVQAYKGAHFSVGGLMNQLKGVIGGSQSISLLLAELKTFQGQYDFNAVTKDKLDIKGTVTIEMQLNPEKPQNILGMMAARKSLAKADVAARLKPLISDRVFEAAVSRHAANEVRGNTGLQDMIQAAVMTEVERVAGDLGILVRNVSVEWAINDVEKKEMQRAAALRDAEQVEFEFKTLKRAMERENETTELKIASKLNAEKLNLQSGADLERLVMDQEIEFVDAREDAKRMQEMKVLQHEINMLKGETLFKFEQDIQKATHDGVDMKVIHERKRKIERETEYLDTEHKVKVREFEDDAAIRAEKKRMALQQEKDVIGRQGRLDETKVWSVETETKLAAQIAADEAAIEKLKGLRGIEAETERTRLENQLKSNESAHKNLMAEKQLAAEQEINRLKLAANLTAEQIMATNAGLNADVAKVLAERAKAEGANNTQAMDLMRQMVEMANRNNVQNAEQAKAMFNTAIQGTVGAAAAAAGKAVPASVAGLVGGGEEAKVDCPKCGRENTAKARFCVGCGEQLRK